MTPRVALAPALLTSALFLFGCPGEEPTDLPVLTPREVSSAELLADANANLRTHLVGAEAAAEDVDVAALLGELLPTTEEPAPPPCPEPGPCDEPAPEPEPSMDAAAIADMMAAEVLHADHIEASSPTSVTLRFDDAMCPADGETGARDPDCVAAAAQLQPRLHLTSLLPGDVDAALQIGATRTSVARLELHAGGLALEADLGAAKAALASLARSLDDVPPEVLAALDAATVRGVVRLALTREADGAYLAELGAPSGLELEAQVEGEQLSLDVEPAAQLAWMRMQPSPAEVQLGVATNGARMSAPMALLTSGEVICTSTPDGETICEEEGPAFEGQLEVRTPAASLDVTVAGEDRMSLALASSGPAQVKLDGRTIFEAELTSPSATLDIQSTQDGLQIAAQPSLSMAATFDLAPIAAELDVPAWLVNERLEVRLDGAARPALTIEDESGRLRVDAGRLTLSSRAASVQITAEAGQCLAPIEDEPSEDAHPFELLEAGACR